VTGNTYCSQQTIDLIKDTIMYV